MYFSRTEQAFAAGHESAGVTAPATRWFLAEGATGSFFNTFILIANPGTQAASVEMQYLLTDGQVVTRNHDIAPQSRLTLNAALEDPVLLSAASSDDRQRRERRPDHRRTRDVVAGGWQRLVRSAQRPG